MDHNPFSPDTAAGRVGGAVLAIFVQILNLDWHQWLETTALNLLNVALAGLVGGAMGMIGQVVIKRIFKIKK